MSKERRPFEFSDKTKKDALELAGYRDEISGDKEDKKNRLQAHHMVAIWFAREMGISAEVIKSLANIMCLSQETHTYMHLQENRHQYEYLAWYLFGIDVSANESLDSWKKDKSHPIHQEIKKSKRKRRRK